MDYKAYFLLDKTKTKYIGLYSGDTVYQAKKNAAIFFFQKSDINEWPIGERVKLIGVKALEDNRTLTGESLEEVPQKLTIEDIKKLLERHKV